MKNCDRKPEHIFLHIIQMNLNTLRNLTKFSIAKSTVGSSYKESKFKPCLTKQLLNKFKLWYVNGTWGDFNWECFLLLSDFINML